jgi:hypothetical protein
VSFLMAFNDSRLWGTGSALTGGAGAGILTNAAILAPDSAGTSVATAPAGSASGGFAAGRGIEAASTFGLATGSMSGMKLGTALT